MNTTNAVNFYFSETGPITGHKICSVDCRLGFQHSCSSRFSHETSEDEVPSLINNLVESRSSAT